jgi:hypothetical protein
MIRLLIIILILVFVASKLYGLPGEPEITVPPTSTTKPTGVPMPIPTPTLKPTIVHLVLKNPEAFIPLPPIPPPTSSASEKIVVGMGEVLSGVGTLARDGTVAMVDNGDDMSRATCGLLVIIWAGLGMLGISVLRFIGRLLGGLFG